MKAEPKMDIQEKLAKLSDRLTLMLDKSSMFFADSSDCFGFLRGIGFVITSLDIVDITAYNEVYESVAKEHGWKWVANSFYSQLKDDGVDEAIIIETLLTIEIEVLNRLRKTFQ